MVMTTEGELISASTMDIQPERWATLTRSQRQNRNRRIRKMLDQLREGQEKEDILANAIAVSEDQLLDRSVGVALPQFVISSDDTDYVRNYVIPEYTPAKVNSTRSAKTSVPKPKKKKEGLVEVEPYVPQFVSRPRQLQIVCKDEMDRFQNVRKQNFEHFQRIQGKYVNILESLELHTDVFSDHELEEIVKCLQVER